MNSGTTTGADRAPGPPTRRVLEDESGHRVRRLRFVGRSVALLALCWLALIVLGGLGVGPAEHLPFGSKLRLSVAPPPLRELPTPHQPTPSDLEPAAPAAQTPPRAGQTTSATPTPTPTTPGRSAAAPGRTNTTATRGKAAAPGQATTRTIPGGAAAAPGRIKHDATTTTRTTRTPKTPPAQSKRKP